MITLAAYYRRYAWAALAAAIVWYACSVQAGEVGPTMEQEKAAVDQFNHRLAKDPYSIMDLEIDPAFWNTKAISRKDWVIKFRCNSKNSFGAYTGIKEHVVMWKNGAIDWEATQNRLVWESFAAGLRQ